MSKAQREKIQQLLGAEKSPLRDELLDLGFAALSAAPLCSLTSAKELAASVLAALTKDNAERITTRHVLSGIERVTQGFRGSPDQVRDALSEQGVAELKQVVSSGKGPRFLWLKGAIDPDDFRQLLAPVVQQVLVQFTTKLPVPGFSGGGGSGQGGGLGGLVGRIGKQVQKGAGQLADVGKSVMSGLGGELERRMQAVARDFSQTATSEFRSALVDRLKSVEGRAIVSRIRDRVLERVLSAKLDDVVSDFMHLPVRDIASVTTSVIGHLPSRPLFQQLVELEVAAVFEEMEQRSLADMLREAGILPEAKRQIIAAVEPGLTGLIKSDAFGAFLERLLEASSTP